MKHTKRWVSLLLAVMVTVAAPLSAFAAWEDGFVIPGQNGSSNSYDDLFWDTTNKSDSTTISSSTTEDKKKEDATEKEDTGSKKSDEKTADAVLPDTKTFSVESGYSAVPLLADNYTEIYGTDSMPKARSATGSGPYDYLQANGGYVTITADRPLRNILHYDGKIVDNIHIAKWISDNPSELEYPAYCKNPGWKGTAQHAAGEYKIAPLASIGAKEKKILGVARAGYPYKTPSQLGCNNVDEAYYATHGAIHTAIVGGSLDKWSIQSGDTARNTRVLNALKKIYTEGISNPYTPPEVTVKLSPVSGSEEASAEGEWVTNTYHFDAGIDRDTWKFRILGDDIMSMVENVTIDVYAGSKKLTPQTNVSGAWDTAKAFRVDMGQDVTVKVPKALAEATGINYTLYGTTVGGDLKTAATYLGNPIGLSSNWQGYLYNFRPQGTDSAAMTYNSSAEIPDTPDPDSPVSSNKGSLVVEKLDYQTKKKVADAVFHIHGVSESNHHINISVKASNGATAPVIGRGANIRLSDGVIKLTGIPAGVYEVTEVSAPPHYSVAVGQNSQSVRVENDAELHPKVTFENKPFGSLTIRKVDAQTQETLAGFYFKVVNHTTGFEQTVETGKNGEVTIEDLPEGSYEVTEIAARFDYILDATPQIGEVDWGSETVVVMKNEKKPSITIKKIDAETSEAIEGVHFEIKHKNTRQTYMGVTNAEGMIELIDVEEGWYEVTEVTPADGYISSDKVYEVYAKSGKPGTVTIKNAQKSGIMIEKVDVDGKGIAGASFNIFRFGEDTPLPNTPVTTGADGTVTIRRITPGHYQIQELRPANGYLPNDRVYDVTVEEGTQKLTKVQVVNHRAPDLTIVKRDSRTGKALAGAMFTVEKLENPDKGFVTGSPFTTDDKGEILLKDLKPGAYKVCEVKAPNSYESGQEVRIVNLVADEDFKAVFENTEKATLTVNKIDSITKEPLKNARFEVYRAVNGSSGGETVKVGEYTSDANGQFQVSHTDTGWYRILEKQAPAGYERKAEALEVFLKAGEDKEITFENSPQSAIIIKKVDRETGAALTGIRFEIRYLSGATGTEGTVIGTYTTSKNGTITVAGLKPGVYSVAEVSSDSDHILDDTLKTVTLKDDNSVVTVEFTNAPLGGLLIKKMDAVTKEPLSDVIFKVTDMKGAVVGESNGEYRTDETGSIYIPQLIGGYIVQEVKAKDGYLLDNTAKTIYIEKGRVYSLEFFNQPYHSLIIEKVDRKTQKPLEGAKFEVRKIDGAYIGNYITAADGRITIPDLKPDWYVVKEIAAPEGYCIDTAMSKNVQVKSSIPTMVKFENDKNATLRITKTDSVTGEPMENVEFTIVREDGKTYGKHYTNRQGEINLEYKFPAGTYLIRETNTRKGYALDTNVRKVVLDWGDDQLIEWENYPLASIRIKKTDAETEEAIPGVKFEIYNKNKESIGTYITDSKGVISLEKMFLGDSTYYIEERENKGYVVTKGLQTVKTKWGKTTMVELENKPILGKIIIRKTAADNNSITGNLKGDGLKDAKFTIYDADGKRVDVLKTDSKGFAESDWLRYGKYTMKETTSPLYFLLSDEIIRFEIEKDGQVVELERENKSTILNTHVEKSGYQETMGGSVIRYDLFNIRNNSKVALEDFYLHESLPVDAAYITRLFTGTFNQNRNYAIYYKTNKTNGFRILKDNLFTNKVYEIDCTKGMMAGEYITDIKYMFGSVEPGFKEIERPFIYCKTYTNLPNGYRFTNRVEVGGMYEMQKVKAEDTFTTKIYAPTVNRGKLPKTGY